jgi:hypothetical protein
MQDNQSYIDDEDLLDALRPALSGMSDLIENDAAFQRGIACADWFVTNTLQTLNPNTSDLIQVRE